MRRSSQIIRPKGLLAGVRLPKSTIALRRRLRAIERVKAITVTPTDKHRVDGLSVGEKYSPWDRIAEGCYHTRPRKSHNN